MGEILKIPDISDSGDDWHKRGEAYKRILVLQDPPRTVDPGWFWRLSTLMVRGLNISADFKPIDRQEVVGIDTTLISTLSSRRSHYKNYKTVSSLYPVLSLSELFQGKFEHDNTQYFKVSIKFLLTARNKVELDHMTALLEKKAREGGWSMRRIYRNGNVALRAASPFSPREIKEYVVMTSRTVAYLAIPMRDS